MILQLLYYPIKYYLNRCSSSYEWAVFTKMVYKEYQIFIEYVL